MVRKTPRGVPRKGTPKRVERRVPVTVLNGFLGSGKTTVLQSLLTQSWRAQLRVAVIVNDLSDLDVDGIVIEETDVVAPGDGNLITITGGSIHEGERLDAFARACTKIVTDNELDHLFIETSGNTRPGPIVSYLHKHRTLRLHGFLTLVDAAMMRDDYDLGRTLATHSRAQLDDDVLGVETLLLEQLMFASEIYLSKVEKLADEQLQVLATAVHRLNPRVPITAVQYGNLRLSTVLDQPVYRFDQVGMLGLEIARRDLRRTEPDPVISIVVEDPRPFHPQRLWEAFTEELPQALYRSKGFTWLPTRDDHVLLWNQAAGGIGLEILGYWKAGILAHTDSDLLPEEVKGLRSALDGGDPVFGDRRTQITVLGPAGPARKFADLLRTCLLTDEQVRDWQAGAPFDDPWPTTRVTLTSPE